VDVTIGNITTNTNTAYVDATSGKLQTVANSAYQPLIGTDLTNDHPVGVVYSTSTATYAGLTSSLTNQGSYFTPTGTNWRIYEGGNGTGKVECGSCHDPHTENNSGHSGETNKFLRGSVAAICQDCHANK
jgi:predicted CXXCH cytochrome family protein